MRKIFSIFLFIAIISLVLVGCEELPESQKTKDSNPTTVKSTAVTGNIPDSYPVNIQAYPGQDNKILRIIKADNSTVDLSVSDLAKLTKVKITADGKPQEGYKLLDILAQGKVSNFSKVTLTAGKTTLSLTKNDVDDQVILNLGDGLTVISGKLKADQWLKYVTQIKID